MVSQSSPSFPSICGPLLGPLQLPVCLSHSIPISRTVVQLLVFLDSCCPAIAGQPCGEGTPVASLSCPHSSLGCRCRRGGDRATALASGEWLFVPPRLSHCSLLSVCLSDTQGPGFGPALGCLGGQAGASENRALADAGWAQGLWDSGGEAE